MDSCCATLRANMNPMEIEGGVNHVQNGFWGKKIKGILKNRAFVRSQNMGRKIKPGMAISVLTPDINNEIMVRKLHLCDHFVHVINFSF